MDIYLIFLASKFCLSWRRFFFLLLNLGDRRRLLLRGLTQSLPDILPLLYTVLFWPCLVLLCISGTIITLPFSVQLLEKHFGAALIEVGSQQFEIAKHHAATVIATLNAINAYAEWAPVSDLAKFGIIHG